jgi:hypothetical protein
MSRTKDKISFLRLLNENLSHNPFYARLFDVVGQELEKQIGEPLAQLARIRSSHHIKRGDYIDYNTERGRVAHVRREIIDGNPFDVITLQLKSGAAVTVTKRALQDREILVDSAIINGFDYYSDYLGDEDYARIHDYIAEFWGDGGIQKSNFVNFLGYIKNMRLNMEMLWTKDQGDFANSDDPSVNFHEYLITESDVTNPITAGGDQYLTSHVELTYDAIATPEPNFNDLISLFYYFAPIHLVLERILGGIYVDVFLYNNISAHYDAIHHIIYEWKPEVTLEQFAITNNGSYDVFQPMFLYLDVDLEEALINQF